MSEPSFTRAQFIAAAYRKSPALGFAAKLICEALGPAA